MLKTSVPILYCVLLWCCLSYHQPVFCKLAIIGSYCPSEAFKFCIIIYLAMMSLSTSFDNKMMKILQLESQKIKFTGTILAISIKSLKDSSFCFSRQQNSCFQFFPLPFYLSISTSSRRKTFKEDAFLWPFFDSSDDPLVWLRSIICT